MMGRLLTALPCTPLPPHTPHHPHSQGGIRLDINLEKARINDEAVELDKQITQAEGRIDKEMAVLEARLELIRSSTKKGLAHFFTAVFIAYAAYRFVMLAQHKDPPHAGAGAGEGSGSGAKGWGDAAAPSAPPETLA